MEKAAKKLVCLISGGIDSPVAAHLMMRAGAELVLVHMDSRPFSGGRATEKTKKLASIVAKASGKSLKMYLVPHGKIQQKIVETCPRKLTCILCRRMMHRAAEAVAKKEDAKGIVTGESLGQVASQTLDNLAAEDNAVSLPIHRPLLGLDKEEVIRIAKEIGTYETSTLPGECCSMVPPFPETHAQQGAIGAAEKKFDAQCILRQALAGATVVTIKNT